MLWYRVVDLYSFRSCQGGTINSIQIYKWIYKSCFSYVSKHHDNLNQEWSSGWALVDLVFYSTYWLFWLVILNSMQCSARTIVQFWLVILNSMQCYARTIVQYWLVILNSMQCSAQTIVQFWLVILHSMQCSARTTGIVQFWLVILNTVQSYGISVSQMTMDMLLLSQSSPPSWIATRFGTRVSWRVTHIEQELHYRPGHLNSPQYVVQFVLLDL